jgi:hypothetical protein
MAYALQRTYRRRALLSATFELDIRFLSLSLATRPKSERAEMNDGITNFKGRPYHRRGVNAQIIAEPRRRVGANLGLCSESVE